MPTLENKPFNGSLQDELLYILLKDIEQKTILYSPDRAARNLAIDGYSREAVFLHYQVLKDEECFDGFTDIHGAGRVVAFRLTSTGYQRLAMLKRQFQVVEAI